MEFTSSMVNYTTQNAYYWCGASGSKVKQIWILFHGYAQMGESFGYYTNELDLTHTLVVSLQAPSKFYTDHSFDKAGASWLTKFNTPVEIQNNLNYIDAVWKEIQTQYPSIPLHVLGFSQGVSMLSRWVGQRKIMVQTMVIWAGRFPEEMTADDFSHLPSTVQVFGVLGKEDPYAHNLFSNFKDKMQYLFGQFKYLEYDGGHKMDRATLAQITGL